jgi:PST family polysaccharide transporter
MGMLLHILLAAEPCEQPSRFMKSVLFNVPPGLHRMYSSIGWLGIERVFRLVVALITQIALARYLGAEAFGYLNAGIAFLILFSCISLLGINRLLVKELVQHPEQTGELVGTSIVVQFLAGMGTGILMLFVLYQFVPSESAEFLALACLVFVLPLQAVNAVQSWFESQVRSDVVAKSKMIALGVVTLIKLTLIVLSAPFWPIVMCWVLEAAFFAGLLGFRFNREAGANYLLRCSWARAKGLLRGSWPLMASALSTQVYMRIDQLMLGKMLSMEQLGYYSASVWVSELPYALPLVLMTAVYPVLVASRHQPRAFQRNVQIFFDVVFLLSILIAVVITVSSEQLILLLYGEAFLSAVPVLKIHIWALCFVSFGVISGSWLVIEGLEKLALQRALVGAVVNIALNLILIPKYGMLGAAWATIFSYGLSTFVWDLTHPRTRELFRMKLHSVVFPAAVKRLFAEVRNREREMQKLS